MDVGCNTTLVGHLYHIPNAVITTTVGRTLNDPTDAGGFRYEVGAPGYTMTSSNVLLLVVAEYSDEQNIPKAQRKRVNFDGIF